MKKISWLDKPITWRTSFKVSAYGCLFAIVVDLIYFICIIWGWDTTKDWCSKKLKQIKKSFNK